MQTKASKFDKYQEVKFQELANGTHPSVTYRVFAW